MDKDLEAMTKKFDAQRWGISDPLKLIAAELRIVTELLLEVLKELRKKP
jgi:hypothetical protein